MELTNLSSNFNNQYSTLLKQTNSLQSKLKINTPNNQNQQNQKSTKIQSGLQKTKSVASNNILAKKGQAGYMKEMDLDNDGQVTLEEFNDYCQENGISNKEKLSLIMSMQAMKMSSQMVEESLAKKSEKTENSSETASQNQDNKIYAKRGDSKYVDEMDSNGNGTITYAEYLDYINKTEESKNTSSTKETKEEKSSSEDAELYEAKSIEPEVQSTVEYEV